MPMPPFSGPGQPHLNPNPKWPFWVGHPRGAQTGGPASFSQNLTDSLALGESLTTNVGLNKGLTDTPHAVGIASTRRSGVTLPHRLARTRGESRKHQRAPTRPDRQPDASRITCTILASVLAQSYGQHDAIGVVGADRQRLSRVDRHPHPVGIIRIPSRQDAIDYGLADPVRVACQVGTGVLAPDHRQHHARNRSCA